jgi:hypothetical protein
MREACRLLVYTRASVASVGYSLGYEDPSYFSRAFRRAIQREMLKIACGSIVKFIQSDLMSIWRFDKRRFAMGCGCGSKKKPKGGKGGTK